MLNQQPLFALVRSVLLTGLADRFGANAPQVKQVFQPQIVGATSAPVVTMQHVMSRRTGAMGRSYRAAADPADPMTGTFTQWWETTLQIGAFAARDPNAPDFMTLPSSQDFCTAASYVLQSDAGLAALAVAGVRPLRVTDLRNVPWTNERDQYEMHPSFDLTLSRPEVIVEATAPVAEFEAGAGRV